LPDELGVQPANAQNPQRRVRVDAPPAGFVLNELPSNFLWSRVLAVVIIAGVAVLVPAMGPHRLVLALLLIAIVVPTIILSQRALPPKWRESSQAGLDLFAIATLVHLVPSAWCGAVVLAGAVLSQASFVMTLRTRLGYAGLITGGLAFAAIEHHLNNWHIPLLALWATPVPIGLYADWWNQRVLLAAKRTEMMITDAQCLFWEANPETGKLTSVQGRCEEITGYSAKELMARFPSMVHSDDRQQFDFADTTNGSFDLTFRALRPSDEPNPPTWRYFRTLGRTKTDGLGRAVRTGMTIDVTELEESKLQLQLQAETDPLTGLRNRSGLASFIERQLSKDTKVGFLLIDLDGFKDVNDAFGHASGDALIATMGHRLRELATQRHPDLIVVVRLGGDEFGIVLVDDPKSPNPLGPAAEEFAHLVREKLSEPTTIDDQIIRVSASIGVAFAHDRQSAGELLRNADVAMYAAKRARTGVEVFSVSAVEQGTARLKLQTHLISQLEAEIELWYQPIVDVQTGRIVSIEALARWNHPEHGMLPPDDFLELVDAARLANRFDRHVLEQAANTAGRLAKLSHPVSVAVNLSPNSIWSPPLMSHLAALVSSHRLPAGSLTVEISERDLLDDHPAVLPALHRLRALGVGLALDDYGTGYSSLTRIRQLPLTELKIDRSFVSQIADSEVDQAIVHSTLDLAASLGMTTVAEGVETVPIAEMLKGWGCHRIQGYLYAKPGTLEDVLRLLESQPLAIGLKAHL
jgi:diguanylate cyclase (GGDEF)-like protein